MVFQKYLSGKKLCFLAIWGFALSIFLASLMTNLASFTLFYTGFMGFFLGVGYIHPLKNAYSYFPNRKGLCSGICMTGYGIGSFFYNQVFLGIINPSNIQAD